MVRSLGFPGVRTAAFAEMAARCGDVLGLEPVLERPGAAWFRGSGGTAIQVDPEDDADHGLVGAGPVLGHGVGDVAARRAPIVRVGIGLVGDSQRDGGVARNHDWVRDGSVDRISGSDRSAS